MILMKPSPKLRSVLQHFFGKKRVLNFRAIQDAGDWQNYCFRVGNDYYKISKCSSAAHANFIEQSVKTFLEHGLPFAKIMRRSGSWLLQEYVRGRPLTRQTLTPVLIRQIAGILGKMHSIPVPTKSFAETPTVQTRTKFVLEKISYLEKNKAITSQEAERRRKKLLKMPSRYSLVLTHRDFTHNNILVQNGKVHKIIDHGDTTIDIKEYDIARTIYGLGLTPEEEKFFLAGYKKHCSPANFEKQREYWMTAIETHKQANRLKRRKSQ